MSSGEYRSLYRVAFFASLAMLIIIPLQIAVFVMVPVPTSSREWFDLFSSQPAVAMVHADVLLLANNVLISVVYLAFYQALKQVDKGLMQIALVLALIGIAAYISSNKTFELLALAGQFQSATQESDRLILLAAAKAMTAGWQGTAFDAYYVLNAVALVLVALVMFRSPEFSRTTASFGLAAGILMCIPSTAGVLGLVFSLLSLIPWYIFTLMYARVFHRLGARDINATPTAPPKRPERGPL